MELRTLRYFLAVVEEGSITNASRRLHVTQPTLSRQLADLERELGRQLLVRGHDGVSPTEHGSLLARYAESIVGIADKAEADLTLPSRTVRGSVHVACGETRAMELLASAMAQVRSEHPDVTFELYSGTTAELVDGLVRGRYDFLLECDMQPRPDMNVLRLPVTDRWGAVVSALDPLADRETIHPDDLRGRAIITSRQEARAGLLREWLGTAATEVDVAATYSLATNSKFLVRRGVGISLVYEEIIDCTDSDLRFVPLNPTLESSHGLVWRKALPSRQAQAFLDALESLVSAPEAARGGRRRPL